tara:strand:- start:56 stop:646 length:591 start_codon:yes stop_codon:yes gene_type:complete
MEIWKTLWDSFDLDKPSDTPWETHSVDKNLEDYMQGKYDLRNAIDVGCAVGTNASWLQTRGVDTVGIDISEKAIAVATELDYDVEWIVGDFATSSVLDARKFDLIYDRGCFHGYVFPESHFFVHKVSKLLSSKGEWVSIIGAERGDVTPHGPPRKTAAEIVSVVEEHLEIVELTQCSIELFNGDEAPAWRLISRRY